MKKLTYTLNNNLNQLQGELIAAIPALRPVTINGERHSVMSVTGLNNSVSLYVADDADEAAIQVVIDAHTPA